MAYKKGDKIAINMPKQDKIINKYEDTIRDLTNILSYKKYNETEKKSPC